MGGNYNTSRYDFNYNKDEIIKIDKNKNISTLTTATATETATSTYGTFTCPGPMYIFATNKNGTVDSQQGPSRIYWLKIYDNGTLVRDYIPCRNVEGQFGLYDKVNHNFIVCASTYSFGNELDEIVWEGKIARKIKAIYVGVNGFAKKIKKAYIGVNGKAK